MDGLSANQLYDIPCRYTVPSLGCSLMNSFRQSIDGCAKKHCLLMPLRYHVVLIKFQVARLSLFAVSSAM
jgi:hypothetical protein